MEKNNMTAVEWLETEINKIWEGDITYMEMPRSIYYKLIEQAKQMEKEQLNIARIDGINLANKGYGKQ